MCLLGNKDQEKLRHLPRIAQPINRERKPELDARPPAMLFLLYQAASLVWLSQGFPREIVGDKTQKDNLWLCRKDVR